MRYFYILGSLLLIVVSAACGAPAGPTPAPPTLETPADSGYPPPLTTLDGEPIQPLPSPLPDGYPAPPPTPALPLSYPAEGPVWIVRAVGEQCAEEVDYHDLKAAVSALEDAGVAVSSSETVDLIVCQGCGCPTSEHFRAQIEAADYQKATALGWILE